MSRHVTMTRDKKAHKRPLRVALQRNVAPSDKEQITCWYCDVRLGSHMLGGMCSECSKAADDAERANKIK